MKKNYRARGGNPEVLIGVQAIDTGEEERVAFIVIIQYGVYERIKMV